MWWEGHIGRKQASSSTICPIAAPRRLVRSMQGNSIIRMTLGGAGWLRETRTGGICPLDRLRFGNDGADGEVAAGEVVA